MILLDANILIYAHSRRSPFHEMARSWLDSRLNAFSRVGMPWPSLLAFIRIVSNPRILEMPESISNAWRQVQEWLACPTVWIPQPMERHSEVLGRILESDGVTARLVPDAHLAALAIEHGLILCSTDGDFARFPGLRWENPLRGTSS